MALLGISVAALVHVWHLRSAEVEMQNLVCLRSAVTGRYYWVLRSANQQAAADLLATLDQTLVRLVETIEKRREEFEAAMQPGIGRLLQAHHRRSGLNILELDSATSPHIAFNRNKSEVVYICLRENPPDEALGRLDTLLYIMIHELAHTMLPRFAPRTNGGATVHGKEFREHEAFLMRVANEHGYLDPALIPHRVHCGRIIPAPDEAP